MGKEELAGRGRKALRHYRWLIAFWAILASSCATPVLAASDSDSQVVDAEAGADLEYPEPTASPAPPAEPPGDEDPESEAPHR